MTTRRTLLGALKCAFRDLRRELAMDCWTLVIVMVIPSVGVVVSERCRSWKLCVDLRKSRLFACALGGGLVPVRSNVPPLHLSRLPWCLVLASVDHSLPRDA